MDSNLQLHVRQAFLFLYFRTYCLNTRTSLSLLVLSIAVDNIVTLPIVHYVDIFLYAWPVPHMHDGNTSHYHWIVWS